MAFPLPIALCALTVVLSSTLHALSSTPWSQKPITLRGVPIPTTSYMPQTVLHANYESPKQGGRFRRSNDKPSNPTADFQSQVHLKFNASQPTIMLESLPVADISCTGAESGIGKSIVLNILFDDMASASNIQNAWEGIGGNFNVLLSHERKCIGVNEFSALEVTRIHPKSENNAQGMIHLDATFLNVTHALPEISITIEHTITPKVSGMRTKRSYATDNEWRLPLDLNYDKVTDSASKKSIRVLGSNETAVTLDCINCYSHGEIVLEIHIRSIWIWLTMYKVIMRGDWFVNLEALLTLNGLWGGKLLEKAIIPQIPLTPISIPGLLYFGPTLDILAGISIGADLKIGVQAGFNANLAFNWQVYSESGFASTPEFSSPVNEMKLQAHPITLTVSETVSPAFHLTPVFALGLTLLDIFSFNLDVRTDNALGITFNSTKNNGCPVEKPVSLQLFRQHDITLNLNWPWGSGKTFPLYDSTRLPINCSWCNGCMRPLADRVVRVENEEIVNIPLIEEAKPEPLVENETPNQ